MHTMNKKNKPFLIIQLRPEDETANNEYEAFLKYGALDQDETVRLRAEQNGIPPLELTDYSGIIVGGSPFDISTPDPEKSSLQKQIEKDFRVLFDRVVGTDFPFLGACSGNGLLGSYCGASISRRYGEPVGAANIHLTEAGRKEELLRDFPDTFRALLGHKEGCDEIPPGATLLVRGDTCPVQMFRIKQNVFATQFHPEGDPDGFALRIAIYKHHGYFDPEEAKDLTNRVAHEVTPYANLILHRFVDRYRTPIKIEVQ